MTKTDLPKNTSNQTELSQSQTLESNGCRSYNNQYGSQGHETGVSSWADCHRPGVAYRAGRAMALPITYLSTVPL